MMSLQTPRHRTRISSGAAPRSDEPPAKRVAAQACQRRRASAAFQAPKVAHTALLRQRLASPARGRAR
jgi:hypothetical protein